MLKVITVTNNIEATKPLLNSLEKFHWDWVAIQTEWRGFGTKLIETYNFLKSNPEVDRFIFVDAHDVLVLGTPEEFEEKLINKDCMLLNAERGCWPPPVQEFEHLFKKFDHRYNFLNSGVYYSPSKLFIEIMDAAMPEYRSDDQWYFSMQYLFGRWPINLDNNCDVFQCYSFIEDGDYTFAEKRVLNNKTGTMPLWFHGNGKTDMTKITELL